MGNGDARSRKVRVVVAPSDYFRGTYLQKFGKIRGTSLEDSTKRPYEVVFEFLDSRFICVIIFTEKYRCTWAFYISAKCSSRELSVTEHVPRYGVT